MSGNLGYRGGGIDLSYGQCARSKGWPRSPYHLLWFGCYRSPGRDGRMKNRFGRLHLGCLQWCLVEECGKLRSARSTVSIPNQPSRVFTRRAALYGGHAQARQLILGSCLALDISSSSLEMDWWLCSCGTRSVRYEQRAVRLVGLCNNRRPCTRARLRHPNLHQARPCRLLRIRMATTFAAMGYLPIAATSFSVHGTLCGIAPERLCSADTAAREHFCFEAEMWRAVASLLLLIK